MTYIRFLKSEYKDLENLFCFSLCEKYGEIFHRHGFFISPNCFNTNELIEPTIDILNFKHFEIEEFNFTSMKEQSKTLSEEEECIDFTCNNYELECELLNYCSQNVALSKYSEDQINRELKKLYEKHFQAIEHKQQLEQAFKKTNKTKKMCL